MAITPPRHRKACPPQLQDPRGLNGAPKMVDLNWAYRPPVEQPSNQRHFSGWVLGRAWNIYLDFLLTLPTILTGWKSDHELTSIFWQNLHLSHHHFESEQHFANLEPALKAPMIIPENLGQFHPSNYSITRLEWEHLKKAEFSKSTITPPCVSLLC